MECEKIWKCLKRDYSPDSSHSTGKEPNPFRPGHTSPHPTPPQPHVTRSHIPSLVHTSLHKHSTDTDTRILTPVSYTLSCSLTHTLTPPLHARPTDQTHHRNTQTYNSPPDHHHPHTHIDTMSGTPTPCPFPPRRHRTRDPPVVDTIIPSLLLWVFLP